MAVSEATLNTAMSLNSIACFLAHTMLQSELGQQLFNENVPKFMSKNISGLVSYNKLTLNKSGEICYGSYLTQLESLSDSVAGTYIEQNCSLLVDALGGNDTQSKVLFGIAMLQQSNELNAFFNHLVYDDADSNVLFAAALDLPISDVTDAVSWLTSTPLFESSAKDVSNAQSLNKFIGSRIVLEPADSYLDLIQDAVEQMPVSHLAVNDFEYVQQRELLQKLLNTSTTEATTGVNILIHGEPGVGKTELIKAVADSIGSTLFKVGAHSNTFTQSNRRFGGSKPDASYKIKSNYLLLIQQLFSRNQGVALLCEECEDLFSQGFARNEYSKDAVHELLETNDIPVIYVTNHIDSLPASCIRRMSMVMEVNVPDNRILKNISDNCFSGLRIRNTFKEKLIETKGITPAHLTNAAQVIHLTDIRGKQAEIEVEQLVKSNLSAMGIEQPSNGYKSQTAFNAKYLNIKDKGIEYHQLEKAVSKGQGIRCLLTGPPGTGKTNLVYELSQQTKRPLIVKSASDILDKYVGGTETNIANAFNEAKSVNDNAMLFIDELDSLLQSRQSAERSWEVSQVNELLVQLEQFDQPFFAATNFSERLDKAALRRFDFKLKFDYLTLEQVLSLFCETLNLKQSDLTDNIIKTLSSLKMLTPGEFAIVARRERLLNKRLTVEQATRILVSENDSKRPSAAIGFVQ